MDLYVLNKDLETIGVIDTYISLIWTERYMEADDFEMQLSVPDFTNSKIRTDCYIWQRNSKNLMVIEKISLVNEDDDEAFFEVSGRGLEAVLDRRLTAKTVTIIDKPIEMLTEGFINDTFINPTDERRKTDRIVFEKSGDERIEKMIYSDNLSYAPLLTPILGMAQANEVGFKGWLGEDGKFHYKFYLGEDYSWRQEEKRWIVYSPKFNNLVSTEFMFDARKQATYIYGYGEAESQTTFRGETLTWPQVFFEREMIEATGLDRREVEANLADVPRTWGRYRFGEDGKLEVIPEDVGYSTPWKLSEADYLKVLNSKLDERLDEFQALMGFTAEADENMQWKLGVDIQLGDIVQVVSEFGLESRCRVDSLILSHNTDGLRYYPTFISVDNQITENGGTVSW